MELNTEGGQLRPESQLNRGLMDAAYKPKEQMALNNALHALRALLGCLKL